MSKCGRLDMKLRVPGAAFPVAAEREGNAVVDVLIEVVLIVDRNHARAANSCPATVRFES